jgi:hypothetical protein
VAVEDSAFALAEARRLLNGLGGRCGMYIVRSDTLAVYRLQAGEFGAVSEAREARDDLVSLGYRDSFIVLPESFQGRDPVPSRVECIWWVPGESQGASRQSWRRWPIPAELLAPSIQLLTLPLGYPGLRSHGEIPTTTEAPAGRS